MTVGRSEQAKTLEVDRDRKVLSTVGCVPSVTFLRSLRVPEEKEIQLKYKISSSLKSGHADHYWVKSAILCL